MEDNTALFSKYIFTTSELYTVNMKRQQYFSERWFTIILDAAIYNCETPVKERLFPLFLKLATEISHINDIEGGFIGREFRIILFYSTDVRINK